MSSYRNIEPMLSYYDVTSLNNEEDHVPLNYIINPLDDNLPSFRPKLTRQKAFYNKALQ